MPAPRAGRMSLRSWFDQKTQQVCIELIEGDQPIAHITLELPEFSTLLRNLGQLRTKFAEPVPRSLEPRARMDVNDLTAYSVISGPSEEGRVLAVRHPGYGWLAFAIPERGCSRISADLVRQAARPAQKT